MIMMAAPLLGPALGTYLLKIFGWKSIFTFLSIYSLLVLLLMVLFIPETRIEKTRIKIIRKTVSNYASVLFNAKAMSFILSAALAFSGMYTFIIGSSKIYIEHFNIPLELFPILFSCNSLLMIIIGGINARLVTNINPQKILKVGLSLQLLFGTLLFLTILSGNAPFVLVFILMVLFVGVLGIIFGNANALVLNMYPNSSGTTTAIIGVTEFAIAAIVGLILHTFQNDTILPIGITMFACALASNLSYRVLNKIGKNTQ
jgi:DHA1 family bicyclomycin/chloramphenicol resistance-like MFS transporter